jgi:hypothetical protein
MSVFGSIELGKKKKKNRPFIEMTRLEKKMIPDRVRLIFSCSMFFGAFLMCICGNLRCFYIKNGGKSDLNKRVFFFLMRIPESIFFVENAQKNGIFRRNSPFFLLEIKTSYLTHFSIKKSLKKYPKTNRLSFENAKKKKNW